MRKPEEFCTQPQALSSPPKTSAHGLKLGISALSCLRDVLGSFPSGPLYYLGHSGRRQVCAENLAVMVGNTPNQISDPSSRKVLIFMLMPPYV